ncbi:WD40 repeat-like protein [Plenodomus tracheiphilus IPT5]|uniref:WD40 repeat-like protein n=1 Tax=Plenodomus tracheiphilus IPT5 TaxID=1408161 RepID=A0A6A7ASJ7_9PLEO|nr:WD40 repeat-like protein [Plenodomus tracheiphilus IPT5]
MSRSCYTSHDFVKEYDFPLEPERDFESGGGVPARYASGHPKEWSDERPLGTIDFSVDDGAQGSNMYRTYHTALSSDGKLLAISTHAEHILIYDVVSKVLRQKLDGAGHLLFRPIVHDEDGANDPADTAGRGTEKPVYTIVSSANDEASYSGPNPNRLIFWDLDRHGRVMDVEEPINPAAFATRAIEGIAAELLTNHEWTKDFIDSSALHTKFEKALSQVAVEHRRRHNTILNDAVLGSFGSTSFNSDGKFLLYHTNNESTQMAIREADSLPQVVVYDVEANKELHRLSGHTDAIMWSAFSPDGELVASVSWDGTLRMYSATTGGLVWATEDSGGQSWTGAFSSDSKFIAWSSKSGREIHVLDTSDGRQLSTFPETPSGWCRCLVWHPNNEDIALCVDKHAYVWNVFDGPNGSITQHYTMDKDKQWAGMAGIQRVSWMNKGQLLALEFSEGTNLVYDVERNTKELFKRSKGGPSAWIKHSIYGSFNKGENDDYYLSVDGDGKIRYWRKTIAAVPSWWDKELKTGPFKKVSFPETGKYVKITRKSDKITPNEETSNTGWVEKGAEPWTAE